MSRIQSSFERLAGEGRKALIPFITAGDPQPDLTLPLMRALVAGGADIIELGVPFSDPMADGPTIQRASERALAHGMSLRRVLELVERIAPRSVGTLRITARGISECTPRSNSASRSRGRSRSIFFRLWVRAPRMRMCCMNPSV